MSRLLTHIFCTLVVVLCLLPSFAGADLVEKPSRGSLRSIPSEKLDELRSNPEFQYGINYYKTNSVWNKIKRYINELIRKLFSDKGVAPYIRYLIILIVFILVVLKLSGSRIDGLLFGSGKKIVGEVILPDENLHEADLNDLAEKAATQGNLRLAIRYYYLQLLKSLNEEGLIQWHKDKTNRDYLREIDNPEIRRQFLYQTLVFDHVWYGNFEIEASHFQKIRESFSILSSIVKPQKKELVNEE